MRDDWLKNLKINDEVVVSGGSAMAKDYVARVERLTKTQIILTDSSTKYRRSNGGQIGGNSWSTRWLREADKEKVAMIKHDQEKRSAIYYLDDFKWIDLSLESLQTIVKVVKNL